MPVKKTSQAHPNFLLRRARQEHGWSQQEIADLIGATHAFMISRWEIGTAIPGPEYRKKLCALFGKSLKELGLAKQQVEPEAEYELAQAPISDSTMPFRLTTSQPFVGRDQLLADLVQQLCGQEPQQLIALYGLPGIGKTTLAMELAHLPEVRDYFGNGILWAGLGPQANILALFSRWGRLFGLSKDECKGLYSDDAWAQALHNVIGTRRILLIIDDSWSIEDALRCKIGGPNCSYVLTTRLPEVATRFAGNQTLQVPELSLNDGIQLITQIAPALVEMLPEVPGSLVQSVGGHPLALTLIGNYLLIQTRHLQHRRALSALARLQQAEEWLRLELPQAGLERDSRLLPGTPFTLQAVIHMSEVRLDLALRQALSALAIFPAKPNTFSEEAALAVAALEVDLLDQLVDTGFIEVNRQGRYQLHQVISDYERSQGCNRVAEERMVDYMVSFVERHKTNYNLLEQELNNITATLQLAFERKMYTPLIRGTLACSKFLYDQGLQLLSAQMLKQALGSAVLVSDNESKALILLDLTNIYKMCGDYKLAEEYALECLFLLRQQEDASEVMCDVLAHLGHIHIFKGSYECAKGYLHEGLSMARKHRLQRRLCRLLGLLGIIADLQGDIVQAEDYWKEGLTFARRLGEPETLSYILGVFGAGLYNYKRYDEAEAYLQEGLLLVQKRDSRPEICHFLLDLGELALQRGEEDEAEERLQESLSLARQMNLHPALSAILLKLGELEMKCGEEDQALMYLQEGLTFALQRENKYFISSIYSAQGCAYLQRRELEQAETAFQEALACAPEKNWLLMAVAHYGLARVALFRGEIKKAQEWGEKSLHLFEEIKNPQAEEVKQWLLQL